MERAREKSSSVRPGLASIALTMFLKKLGGKQEPLVRVSSWSRIRLGKTNQAGSDERGRKESMEFILIDTPWLELKRKRPAHTHEPATYMQRGESTGFHWAPPDLADCRRGFYS